VLSGLPLVCFLPAWAWKHPVFFVFACLVSSGGEGESDVDYYGGASAMSGTNSGVCSGACLGWTYDCARELPFLSMLYRQAPTRHGKGHRV
jgi:hypothetical protein